MQAAAGPEGTDPVGDRMCEVGGGLLSGREAAVRSTVPIVIVAAILVLSIGGFPNVADDFRDYLGAERMLQGHGSLYAYTSPWHGGFTYPPFAGLLLYPIVVIDDRLVIAVWILATLAVVHGVVRILMRRLTGGTSYRHRAFVLIWLGVLATGPVLSDLRWIQVSFFIGALVIVDCLGIVPERYRGLATGLAAAVKLTPLFFIFYFWFAGLKRAAVVAAATFCAACVTGWLCLPGDSARYWFGRLWEFHAVGDPRVPENQSLTGILSRFALMSGSSSPAWFLLALVVGIVALRRAVRACRSGDPLTGMVIAGAATIVVSPISWVHHCIWLIVAAALPIGRSRAVRIGWPIGCLAVLILLDPVMVELPGFVPHVVRAAITDADGILAIAVAVFLPFRPRGGSGHRPSANRSVAGGSQFGAAKPDPSVGSRRAGSAGTSGSAGTAARVARLVRSARTAFR